MSLKLYMLETRLGLISYCKLNSDGEVDPFQEEASLLQACIRNWFSISIILFELNENGKNMCHVTLNSCLC